jgi:hypothetical protein
VAQGLIVVVEKKNGTEQAGMLFLDMRAQDFQNLRERGLRADQPQHRLVEQRQTL